MIEFNSLLIEQIKILNSLLKSHLDFSFKKEQEWKKIDQSWISNLEYRIPYRKVYRKKETFINRERSRACSHLIAGYPLIKDRFETTEFLIFFAFTWYWIWDKVTLDEIGRYVTCGQFFIRLISYENGLEILELKKYGSPRNFQRFNPWNRCLAIRRGFKGLHFRYFTLESSSLLFLNRPALLMSIPR